MPNYCGSSAAAILLFNFGSSCLKIAKLPYFAPADCNRFFGLIPKSQTAQNRDYPLIPKSPNRQNSIHTGTTKKRWLLVYQTENQRLAACRGGGIRTRDPLLPKQVR